MATSIKIGGASGYWGDSAMATPQLLASGGLDYLVFDYLAEITMSIMARAKAKDPNGGYATDFINAVLKPHARSIAENKVKVIANAGGVNPAACAAAARAVVQELGLSLKVAVIEGDDLTARKGEIAATGPTEMVSGAACPEPQSIASVNAYLGAFPIAEALKSGADIVITGRCVDSAVTLGACIHAFGWEPDDWDKLASGSLAGHILECGPQATGGNFTDWEDAGDLSNIGYPIAQISADGSFEVTKPEGAGGVVNVGSVSEQMLYEIGDPQSYMLPDVVCDFAHVEVSQIAPDRVRVSPARGRPAPETYKTCMTYQDGFRVGTTMTIYGFDAEKKANALADAAFDRTRRIFRSFNAGDFTETSVEVIGAGSQLGAAAAIPTAETPSEVVLKIAAKHPDMMGAGLLLKELAGLGLATPPGLSNFAGARPKPSPVLALFSYLTPKDEVEISIDVEGTKSHFETTSGGHKSGEPERPAPPEEPALGDNTVTVPLIKLAWARSGDKGDKANIGVIARHADYVPYIWKALSENLVAERFSHFIRDKDARAKVERFYMPGANAINFLISDVLGGGGVASLRNDPQGKGYGQILLATPIEVPNALAETL
ncbi:MAG: acyclic terpene utilization AtuA family protein [Pseudomonadota bacterium]